MSADYHDIRAGRARYEAAKRTAKRTVKPFNDVWLATALGTTRQTASKHIRWLMAQGWVHRQYRGGYFWVSDWVPTRFDPLLYCDRPKRSLP